MLTFKNYTPNWVKIPKGTAITNVTGEQVGTDEDVLVPPDPIIPGVTSGAAHTVKETLRKDGMIDVKATASGKWKYHFTAAQKLNMAKLIARKTVSEAKAFLLQQPGVANASISVSGPIIDLGGHNMLPDDLRAITING